MSEQGSFQQGPQQYSGSSQAGTFSTAPFSSSSPRGRGGRGRGIVGGPRSLSRNDSLSPPSAPSFLPPQETTMLGSSSSSPPPPLSSSSFLYTSSQPQQQGGRGGSRRGIGSSGGVGGQDRMGRGRYTHQEGASYQPQPQQQQVSFVSASAEHRQEMQDDMRRISEGKVATVVDAKEVFDKLHGLRSVRQKGLGYVEQPPPSSSFPPQHHGSGHHYNQHQQQHGSYHRGEVAYSAASYSEPNYYADPNENPYRQPYPHSHSRYQPQQQQQGPSQNFAANYLQSALQSSTSASPPSISAGAVKNNNNKCDVPTAPSSILVQVHAGRGGERRGLGASEGLHGGEAAGGSISNVGMSKRRRDEGRDIHEGNYFFSSQLARHTFDPATEAGKKSLKFLDKWKLNNAEEDLPEFSTCMATIVPRKNSLLHFAVIPTDVRLRSWAQVRDTDQSVIRDMVQLALAVARRYSNVATSRTFLNDFEAPNFSCAEGGDNNSKNYRSNNSQLHDSAGGRTTNNNNNNNTNTMIAEYQWKGRKEAQQLNKFFQMKTVFLTISSYITTSHTKGDDMFSIHIQSIDFMYVASLPIYRFLTCRKNCLDLRAAAKMDETAVPKGKINLREQAPNTTSNSSVEAKEETIGEKEKPEEQKKIQESESYPHPLEEEGTLPATMKEATTVQTLEKESGEEDEEVKKETCEEEDGLPTQQANTDITDKNNNNNNNTKEEDKEEKQRHDEDEDVVLKNAYTNASSTSMTDDPLSRLEESDTAAAAAAVSVVSPSPSCTDDELHYKGNGTAVDEEVSKNDKNNEKEKEEEEEGKEKDKKEEDEKVEGTLASPQYKCRKRHEEEEKSETRLHPCIRVFRTCAYGQRCAFASYPYDACLQYLKGKCFYGNRCFEKHVSFRGRYYNEENTEDETTTLPVYDEAKAARERERLQETAKAAGMLTSSSSQKQGRGTQPPTQPSLSGTSDDHNSAENTQKSQSGFKGSNSDDVAEHRLSASATCTTALSAQPNSATSLELDGGNTKTSFSSLFDRYMKGTNIILIQREVRASAPICLICGQEQERLEDRIMDLHEHIKACGFAKFANLRFSDFEDLPSVYLLRR